MSGSVSEIPRAAPGEKVVMFINHVKADKCKEFEHLRSDIIKPVVDKSHPETSPRVRFLRPMEQNEDGTYTYVFLADPYLEAAEYNLLEILRPEYGEEQARKYLVDFRNCLASPQVRYALTQSEP